MSAPRPPVCEICQRVTLCNYAQVGFMALIVPVRQQIVVRAHATSPARLCRACALAALREAMAQWSLEEHHAS